MNTVPLIIDNLSFARKGEQLSGKADLEAFPRLQEMLETQAPSASKRLDRDAEPSVIDFLLRGEADAQGRCFIALEIDARLSTFCQRCLDPLALPFKLNFRYLIADVAEGLDDELSLDDNDEYDVQEPDRAMNVFALIEDELIMALPISPTHEFDCAQLITQAGDKPNPFAVLKGLIKS